MPFEILPPVLKEDIKHGCLNCGHTEEIAHLESIVAAGFGYAGITKDGQSVYQDDPHSEEDAPTLQRFEDMAKADPDHDWRFTLNLPLRDAEYQRQGDARWVLVKSGMGFA